MTRTLSLQEEGGGVLCPGALPRTLHAGCLFCLPLSAGGGKKMKEKKQKRGGTAAEFSSECVDVDFALVRRVCAPVLSVGLKAGLMLGSGMSPSPSSSSSASLRLSAAGETTKLLLKGLTGEASVGTVCALEIGRPSGCTGAASLSSCLALSGDAKRILEAPNAGGSSELSEALAFEVLKRLFEGGLSSSSSARGVCSLYKTEEEIAYFSWQSKKTDFSFLLDLDHLPPAQTAEGTRVRKNHKQKNVFAASVCRFMPPPSNSSKNLTGGAFGSLCMHAAVLLRKKLEGIRQSDMDVMPCDMWRRQLLFVWARSFEEASALSAVWASLAPVVGMGPAVLVVCVCEDRAVYTQ
uniref:Uncharacterized protein n=1 Tax=Chromera velia CCMP2878 TaxID=1169474 RepID=A0A0G4FWH8_9ALVE|eukprot:Cvel_18994.t1-p1 / transcript=Cvel_18994.t1 / gene=Cvel_18994 / organism=Chromera_velia_CCMP2878 / gene_product=hypothetical protein / transcript_product=hypothetical protein / location=Cvel_scaffold1607:28923-30321(+) / protein_length=350 / sequence_SO=supercontig / SO=protein_coding / is_pseudo=false